MLGSESVSSGSGILPMHGHGQDGRATSKRITIFLGSDSVAGGTGILPVQGHGQDGRATSKRVATHFS